MAYKRKRRYRRRRYRRRKYTLKKTVRAVKKLNRQIERKTFTKLANQSGISTTPHQKLIQPLNQGITSSTFTGRSYVITGISYRYSLAKLVATNPSLIRLVLVNVKHVSPNDPVPVFDDLFFPLDDDAGSIGPVLRPLSSGKGTTLAKILWQNVIPMGTRATDITCGPITAYGSGYIRCNLPVVFDEDDNITKNLLEFYVMDLHGGNSCTLEMNFKTYYKDM